MVLCYLSAGCNYSVWTLLRRAFTDERGKREELKASEWRESKGDGSRSERNITLFTTSGPENCVGCECQADPVTSPLLNYGY